MKISVVTVVYNGARTLESTIINVLAQSYTDIEYIIIDGASTDGTLDIIKKYEKYLTFWVSEKDSGIYDAMNKGCAIATGDYVIFLGCDDLFASKDVILNMVRLARDPSIIYYGDAYFVERNIVYSGSFTKYKLMQKNICHQAIFYPRSVYKQQRYNCRYKLHADYAYNLEAFSKYKSEYLKLLVTIFNDCGSSSIGDLVFRKEKARVIRLNYGIKGEFFYIVFRPFFLICTKLVKILQKIS